MTDFEIYSDNILKTMGAAVAEALDKKRRLGQYAVIWEGGKIVKLDWSEDKKEEQ